LAVLFCWLVVVLVLVSAVLHFTRLRTLACWLLALLPASLCFGLLRDLFKGTQQLGQASYQSDLKTLLPLVGFLAISVFAALKPKWGWLFWIAWLLGALVCAVVVFLTYFWKVFS
jgi:hypothetical protein